MKDNKMICFDMDGTIADFYNVPNWLESIRAEDVTPYEVAKPMWDMPKLKDLLLKLKKQGWNIRVITWLAKDSSEDYKAKVRKAKHDWLVRHDFPTDACHMVAYGTTKANAVRDKAETAILVDDNAQVRNGWSLGETINPQETNLLTELEKLLN